MSSDSSPNSGVHGLFPEDPSVTSPSVSQTPANPAGGIEPDNEFDLTQEAIDKIKEISEENARNIIDYVASEMETLRTDIQDSRTRMDNLDKKLVGMSTTLEDIKSYLNDQAANMVSQEKFGESMAFTASKIEEVLKSIQTIKAVPISSSGATVGGTVSKGKASTSKAASKEKKDKEPDTTQPKRTRSSVLATIISASKKPAEEGEAGPSRG